MTLDPFHKDVVCHIVIIKSTKVRKKLAHLDGVTVEGRRVIITPDAFSTLYRAWSRLHKRRPFWEGNPSHSTDDVFRWWKAYRQTDDVFRWWGVYDDD